MTPSTPHTGPENLVQPIFSRLRRLCADPQGQAAREEAERQAKQATQATLDGMTAALARLQEGMLTLNARMDQIARLIVAPAQTFPSDLWVPESAAQVRGALALLTPHEAAGMSKCRVGRDFDGGYIMLDDFSGIGAALSLGINDDVSWDSDIAARGIDIWQFDPTIAELPEANERFHFAPLRIAAADGEEIISLSGILDRYLPGDAGALLLKMDIEGAEWEVFEATPPEVLARFKQIVCEFHNLDRLGDAAFAARAQAVFARLAETHFVVHVHGNNCGSLVNIGNVVLPETLEVSFASRAAYQAIEAVVTFPTELDQPNQEGRADLYLGSFRF